MTQLYLHLSVSTSRNGELCITRFANDDDRVFNLLGRGLHVASNRSPLGNKDFLACQSWCLRLDEPWPNVRLLSRTLEETVLNHDRSTVAAIYRALLGAKYDGTDDPACENCLRTFHRPEG